MMATHTGPSRIIIFTIIYFCLLSYTLSWPENKRVNCRKYVYAPVCRGSVKRNNFPVPTNMNRVMPEVFSLPKIHIFEQNSYGIPSQNQETIKQKDDALIRAIFQQILQRRHRTQEYGLESFEEN